MTLQIEEGKYYEGTDGQKYGPMLYEGADELNHPWYQKGSGLIWLSDGTSSFEPNLIAEWKDTEEMTHEDTPKLWEDMTDEEKGALLLAHHKEETIEWSYGLPWQTAYNSTESEPVWDTYTYYRVKPAPKEPKRETVTLYGNNSLGNWEFGNLMNRSHKITFDLIDGVPDCDSIEMEEL